MPETSPRWTLPGPFIPYLIVMQGDAEAKDASRRVPAETALPQLDNWAAVRGDILQEMELALREPTGGKEPPAPLPCKPGMNQQLKSRLTALLQASRLVVLKAPPVAPPTGAKAAPVPTRKVTYTFDFTTSPSLRLPYVAAIDGVVVGDPSRTGSIRGSNPVTLEVPVGSTVSLFLNSDAHPAYRQNPVYGVSPRERDVRVTIKETLYTKVQPSEVPQYQDTASKSQGRDVYTGTLTGGIWMKVSHRYTEQDVQGLLPAATPEGIREAVLSIYRGDGLPQTQKQLTVTCLLPPPGDKKSEPVTRTSTLTFWGSNNPNENIKDFVLQKDGLTRVHPRAFLVILEAALRTGLQELILTSNWRPMLGSIAHRLGLGLDVGTITPEGKSELNLNREQLRGETQAGPFVSAKEKETFGAYLQAKAAMNPIDAQLKANAEDANKAKTALQTAQKDLASARKVKKGATPDPAAVQAALNDVSNAQKNVKSVADQRVILLGTQKTALASQGLAMAAWREQLEADDPDIVKTFRAALSSHPFVGQLYDPWYVDDDTRDPVAAGLNEQCEGSVGWIHRNHLHITVADPLLLD